jgi:hypothetical protein
MGPGMGCKNLPDRLKNNKQKESGTAKGKNFSF